VTERSPGAPSQAPLRIVAGGQTGVDRAALDAALAAGLPCGGWCPAGRLAEDGVIPARYPVHETDSTDYAERTRRNVEEGDATLVVTDGPAVGGTALTVRLCESLDRPLLVLDARSVTLDEAVDRLRRFLARRRVGVLNVAGPRASESILAPGFARALLNRALARGSPSGRGPAPTAT
jgi:hypothetical protein